MDAFTWVSDTFTRVSRLSDSERRTISRGELLVFHVMIVRCDTDIGGFASVFEQSLDEQEVAQLIDGLRSIDEPESADSFQTVLELLRREKFFDHLAVRKIPPPAQQQMKAIGKQIGSRLWDLDEKLATLLDAE